MLISVKLGNISLWKVIINVTSQIVKTLRVLVVSSLRAVTIVSAHQLHKMLLNLLLVHQSTHFQIDGKRNS